MSTVAQPSPATNPPVSSQTILNVDDNEAGRYVKTRILRAAGYRVIEAGTGKEILELVRESKPQLIVLDVKLPDSDGLAICRTLKSNPATASIMVLLVSAVRVRREDKVAGLEIGADGYLVEPVEPDELLATVKALLRLYRSEQRLQLALKATNDVVWDWDVLNDAFMWNEAGTEVFGWEEPARRPMTMAWRMDRLHPDDRQRVADQAGKILVDRSAEYWHDHYRFQKKEQGYATVLDRAHIVRNEQGEPVRMIGAMLDITDQKRQESELLARNRQQQVLFELADAVNRAEALNDLHEKAVDAIVQSLGADRAAILLFDEQGTMRFSAWRGLSGGYRGAVEGHSPWTRDAVNPEPVVVPDIAEASLDPGLRTEIQKEGIQALGFIPLMYAGRLLGKFMVYFDRPYAMSRNDLSIAQAIAATLAVGLERKRAEAALRESQSQLAIELADTKLLQDLSAQLIHEEHVEAVYDKILDAAMAITDSDFASMQLLYPERGEGGELRLLGYRGFTPQAAEFWEWVRPDSASACGAALRTGRRIMVPDVERCEDIAGTDDLATYVQTGIRAVQTTPLISRGGKVVGMLSTHWRTPHQPSERDLRLLDIVARQAADLIERRRTEEALRQSHELLESRVEERTLDLIATQERLRALASELNLAEQRERKRMAAELHDHLAQMLVLGRLKLSQAKRVPGLAGACADLIAQTQIVLDDSLKYTRTLLAELSPPVLHDFGLPAALTWLGEQMQRHDLTVTVEGADGSQSPLPEDQAMLLFQSVRELLMNASKHAESGTARVSIEERPGELRIQVRDEGKGFDRAATMSSLSKTTEMSSKFGLFSIRERMRALGGRFDLESAPGEGTTATLVLPLVQREVSGLRGEQRTPVLDYVPFSPQSSTEQKNMIRVLLVDDHAMVRQGLKSVLDGYADVDVVGEASNGEEALVMTAQLNPTIVVMDINMPRKNGIEATAELKAKFPRTIVIGLSVQPNEGLQDAMFKAGAAALLTKEAAVDDLYRTIQEARQVR